VDIFYFCFVKSYPPIDTLTNFRTSLLPHFTIRYSVPSSRGTSLAEVGNISSRMAQINKNILTNGLKVMVVGDTAVGKTCLLISFTTNSFPSDHVPTVFDNYTATTVYEGHAVKLGLWDTSGSSDYDKMRPLSYPGTDCFILCFALNNPESFTNVKEKWMPEIREHCPGVPVVLVGTKLDLRTETNAKECISTETGKQLAKEIGAAAYIECSARTQQNLKTVFETVIKVVVDILAQQQQQQEQDAGNENDPKKKGKKGVKKDKDKECSLQ